MTMQGIFGIVLLVHWGVPYIMPLLETQGTSDPMTNYEKPFEYEPGLQLDSDLTGPLRHSVSEY